MGQSGTTQEEPKPKVATTKAAFSYQSKAPGSLRVMKGRPHFWILSAGILAAGGITYCVLRKKK